VALVLRGGDRTMRHSFCCVGGLRALMLLRREDEVPHCIRDDKRRFMPLALAQAISISGVTHEGVRTTLGLSPRTT